MIRRMNEELGWRCFYSERPPLFNYPYEFEMIKPMGANPGGTGGHVPPRFCRRRTQYQMSPHTFRNRTHIHNNYNDNNNNNSFINPIDELNECGLNNIFSYTVYCVIRYILLST